MRGTPPFEDVALEVTLRFALQRPASHRDDLMVQVKPDLDKLARAVLDALEGEVFDNDSRVASLVLHKQYAVPDERTGVVIGVCEIRDPRPYLAAYLAAVTRTEEQEQ